MNPSGVSPDMRKLAAKRFSTNPGPFNCCRLFRWDRDIKINTT
jgi:hypothetical protein